MTTLLQAEFVSMATNNHGDETTDGDGDGDAKPIAKIIGGSIGGVVALILIGVIIVAIVKTVIEMNEVKMSKKEKLVILKAYKKKPTDLDMMIEEVKGSVQQISQKATDLYKKMTPKDLEYRICSILCELLTSNASNFEDTEMRIEVGLAQKHFDDRSPPHNQFRERLKGIVHGNPNGSSEDDEILGGNESSTGDSSIESH